jgi:hypothetical protein
VSLLDSRQRRAPLGATVIDSRLPRLQFLVNSFISVAVLGRRERGDVERIGARAALVGKPPAVVDHDLSPVALAQRAAWCRSGRCGRPGRTRAPTSRLPLSSPSLSEADPWAPSNVSSACAQPVVGAVVLVATVSRVERSHRALRRRRERILERGSGAAIAQHGRGVPHKDAARVRQSLRDFLKLLKYLTCAQHSHDVVSAVRLIELLGVRCDRHVEAQRYVRHGRVGVIGTQRGDADAQGRLVAMAALRGSEIAHVGVGVPDVTQGRGHRWCRWWLASLLGWADLQVC